MANILVVDDEPRIVGFLRRSLSNHGFEVDGSLTGADALTRLRTKSYDLLLLDLMMPEIDGVQLLKAVSNLDQQPQVIIVSARSDVSAKVASLDLGAADYMTKPFALPELVARIRARLRAADPETVVRRGGIALDVVNHAVDVGDGPIRLSHREFALLGRLAQRAGQVCSREELLTDVWGLAHDSGANVVDVCVRRLRVKIGSDRIETVRNGGYRLRGA